MPAARRSPEQPVYRWVRRLVNVEPAELTALAWSFLYFFTLLCGYYIIRPMRDAMGIAGGVDKLQWLFTGTFLVMLAVVPLFGWVASRFPRRRFVPYVYYFFIANLILFFVLFRANLTDAWVARAFFIWASVYNLFVVSVFWSFLADIYTNTQARRLFGFIAAGGTAGALGGPALTALLAVPLGATNLLLVSGAFLGVSVLCVHRLTDWYRNQPRRGNRANLARSERAMGGSVLAGIRLVAQSPYLLGICLLILLFTTLSTFLYFQQAQIVRDTFATSAERTTAFAAIDLSVNALTILIQVFLTARLVKALGLGWTLALIPVLLAGGFVVLALAPVFAVLAVVQVIRRAGNYAITRPAREMLYVVLGREEKYKAKNFIDTVIYRGGDAVSAWAYTGLRALGMNISAVAWLAVPLAALWGWLSWRLGVEQGKISKQQSTPVRRRPRRKHVRVKA